MTCKEGQFDVDDEYGNQGFKTPKNQARGNRKTLKKTPNAVKN